MLSFIAKFRCFLDNRHLPFMKMLLDLFSQMIKFKKLVLIFASKCILYQIDCLDLPSVFQFISSSNETKLRSTLSDEANKNYESILSAVSHFRKSIDFLYKLLVKLIDRGVSLQNLLLALDFNRFYRDKNKSLY